MQRLAPLKATIFLMLATAGACLAAFVHGDRHEMRTSYIVQGNTFDDAVDTVTALDAEITHELAIIRAVAAELTPEEADRVRSNPAIVRLFGNAPVAAAGKPDKGSKGGGGKDDSDDSSTSDGGIGGSSYTDYPTLVDADQLHSQGIDGWGVTVAIVDTGIYSGPGITDDRYNMLRIRAAYDAVRDRAYFGSGRNKTDFYEFDNDDSGHGSHVAGAGFSSKLSEIGKYNGVAPAAKLVSVKVFDKDGRGTYADVIRGVDWVVTNRQTLGIDIMNMSLSAEVRSHYWDDPLNQAVMAAWDEGIVVVVSAGNEGPDAQSIGVPGNVPYVITVGAMTDSYTPADGSDDRLATFSASGPTYEGFVKPEVVAPGGHVMASMSGEDEIAIDYPEFYLGANFFQMSGTSQATGIVSGIAALVLQMEPGLTPDEVKCKLLSGARPAVDANGNLAYSVFQQGAGMVNAKDAVYAWNYGCANQGLDVAADRAGTKHFGGRANQDANGEYYLMGLDGYGWTDTGVGENGYIWTEGYAWTEGYIWTDGYMWTDGRVGLDGYLWTNGYIWTNAYSWQGISLDASGYMWTNGMTEPMSINTWVDPE